MGAFEPGMQARPWRNMAAAIEQSCGKVNGLCRAAGKKSWNFNAGKDQSAFDSAGLFRRPATGAHSHGRYILLLDSCVADQPGGQERVAEPGPEITNEIKEK